ncbi:hypothetical protein [Achromobacter xylosoxidans]|uniref:hypothetical protein n=1 Tax=Alcaligenes xylosoxydans xylosoxydans TaxID=85698 RepID=UPI003D056B22
MEYTITFQERPEKDARPIEDGRDIALAAGDAAGFAAIPNVGDYVQMISVSRNRPAFSGRVEGRLFRYFAADDEKHACHVNIIVASYDEVPDLIKE